ncbi:DUF4249 domain-containing protein [Paraflavitalea pollutisoli]|uniref:DUF4249 domain-containing protein n=1 Tax=Paraflavitalea pollutisoli TaxID=3034143 RepID=UPI0023EB744F|nr:DUF4249 domain-containing protein [Paraflavitalea sp. H1-2-19X]
MKQTLCLLGLIAGVMTGCAKLDVEVQIPEGPSRLVVEGLLTPGYPAEVMLTESNTLQDELVLLAVWNARVSMDTDTGTIATRNILYKKTDRRIMINYGSVDTMREGAHSYFKLNITTKDGRTLRAATKVVSPVRIKSVELNKENIVTHHDLLGNEPRYLRMYAATYKQGKVAMSKSMLYQQGPGTGTSCVMPLSNYQSGTDSITVTLFHIQKEYYDYLTSVENANSAFSDPLLNPEEIISNITGGLGIFTYYTMDKVRAK